MVTKGYGLSIDDIDWSCPTDLEPYAKAHNEELKEKDQLMHTMGIYNKIAFDVIMAHFGAGLAGKKSDAEYIKEPFTQSVDKNNEEEKLQKQRELFVAGLLTMQTNFELSHPKKTQDDSVS